MFQVPIGQLACGVVLAWFFLFEFRVPFFLMVEEAGSLVKVGVA